MVNTRSSHPNGDANATESFKDRHIKKIVNYDHESSNDSFGNSKGPSHFHRVLRKRTHANYQNAFDYLDDEDDDEEPMNRRRRRGETRRNARTLIDTSNSGSPTAGRLVHNVRSTNMSMYDRVKNRRKSTDADIYSEDHEENPENDEQDEREQNKDQNDENDNDEKNSKTKKKDVTTRSNGKLGTADDTNEENTMDVLDQGDDDDDEEEEEEEEELNNQKKAKYSLRERKPPIQRFSLYEQPRQKRKTIFFDDDDERSTRRSSRTRPRGRRVSAHVSSSSTSDSSSDSEGMMPLTNGDLNSRPERTARLAKSTAMKRMRCVPTNLDILSVYSGAKKPSARTSTNAGSGVGALNLELNSKSRRPNNGPVSLADAESIEIDRTITFDEIGGLDPIIRSLKEMIVLPLVYPELFHHYKIKPPRGVLFYGPPGTGKTLVARALVNECSSPDRRIAFFMRKGADCLCKYVGESERQLRLLFEQAYQQRPSIIFFDEIDGLAPVRSARQDQIHASIVSTLLALMDGLDNRGEVVVIGATNRLDAIDPALRRPGRFDREFRFSLPTLEARKQILRIHTKEWESKPHQAFIDEMATRTASFCGADLKSLCQEAFLSALRRRYPQIYESRQKFKIDPRSLHLSRGDFYMALHRIVPACSRGCQHPVGRPLDIHLIPLLSEQLDRCLYQLNELFFKRTLTNAQSTSLPFQSISEDFSTPSISTVSKTNSFGLTSSFASSAHRCATFTMQSSMSNGLCRFFAPAVVQQLDCAFFVFELGYLHGQLSRTPEEACSQLFVEARRSAPAVIYVPDINNLWPKLSESVQYMFISNVRTLPPNLPILILIALETDSIDEIHSDISQIVSAKSTFHLKTPTSDDRDAFFAPLFNEESFRQATTTNPTSICEKIEETLEVLETTPATREHTAQELERLKLREEATMTELRVFLRDMLKLLLRDKRFTYFSRPIDVEDVPDYYEVIENPMTFSMMLEKVDKHDYSCVKQFTQDIDLIVSNALLYNPDSTTQGRTIRHRACELRDVCQFHINAELDMEFELLCQQVTDARKQRGDDPRASLPNYVYTEQSTTNVVSSSLPSNTNENEKSPTNENDIQIDQSENSSITTRTSSRRSKLSTKNSENQQRSTSTRKTKEQVNGHNEETVLSAEDVTTEASAKPATPSESTMLTATQSSLSSSSPSSEFSTKKRSKRTVSSLSQSPSKITTNSENSNEQNKAKRPRTETPVNVVEVEQMEIPTRKIDAERLTSTLSRLVEKTKGFGVEHLSSLWFELFDLIDSIRSFPTEDLIFEQLENFLQSIN